jgi:hypothetical protein
MKRARDSGIKSLMRMLKEEEGGEEEEENLFTIYHQQATEGR